MKTKHVSSALMALIVCVISLCPVFTPSTQAQGTIIVNHFAISPDSRSGAYNPFLLSMISAMIETTGDVAPSLIPVSFAFLPPGSSQPLELLLTYENDPERGGQFIAGASIISSTPFTVGQVNGTFSSPEWSNTTSLQGLPFGIAGAGVKWGEGGTRQNATYYTGGSSDGIMLNELHVAAFSYTGNVGFGQTPESVMATFPRNFPITARFEVNGVAGEAFVNYVIPEPSTYLIAGMGILGLLILRRKRAS